MERCILAAVIAACINFSPAVNAQSKEFCDTLADVADEAPDKFRKFRGARDMYVFYRSKVTLPGATECEIDAEDGEFICYWALGVRGDAATEAKTLADGIAGCFPSAKFRSGSVKTIASYAYTIRGVKFRVGVDDKKNRVRLGIERDD